MKIVILNHDSAKKVRPSKYLSVKFIFFLNFFINDMVVFRIIFTIFTRKSVLIAIMGRQGKGIPSTG